MKRPNIVMIYADDLGYGDIGCYGAEDIQTPHLDALAENGIRFTNWYSNAPVCSPSRASLLTGRYPANAGISNILGSKRGTAGLAADQLTIASVLKDNGYRTGLFGKWHLGATPENGPNAHGFEDFFGFLGGCVDYYSHIYYWGQGDGVNPVHDLWKDQDETWYNGQYLTSVIAEKTVEFIKAADDTPFLTYVPFNAPHYPMHAPEEYLAQYAHLTADRQVMAAMITAMDDGIGLIIDALKQVNKYEDTVIFFSSDNGPSTESRNFLDGNEDLYYGGSAGIFQGHKASLFEGGIREPAILSYPAQFPKGVVCEEVGAMMDIFPTVAALTSIPLPTDHAIDGKSIVNMITKGEQTPHEQICWEYDGQFAIRKGDWKLVLDGKLDFTRKQVEKVQLSNLKDDPGERSNLKDQYPDIVKALKNDLDKWKRKIQHEKGVL